MRYFVLIISVILGMLWSCGNNEKPQSLPSDISGAALYKTHCSICHGDDGRKGFADARVLPDSELTMEERIQLITNGRGTMMPYRGVLTEEEIKAVAGYTLSLE